MRELMARYGATTHMPGLWLYARNDRYWGAEWPRAWFRAYAHDIGNDEFVLTDPVPGSDGHQLLARGMRLWTPPVGRFLHDLGL
jgi:hypothetical protein